MSSLICHPTLFKHTAHSLLFTTAKIDAHLASRFHPFVIFAYDGQVVWEEKLPLTRWNHAVTKFKLSYDNHMSLFSFLAHLWLNILFFQRLLAFTAASHVTILLFNMFSSILHKMPETPKNMAIFFVKLISMFVSLLLKYDNNSILFLSLQQHLNEKLHLDLAWPLTLFASLQEDAIATNEQVSAQHHICKEEIKILLVVIGYL